MNAPHKGWTSRGYLPHFDSPDVVQAITFRLWDALPRHVVEMVANTSGEEVSAERRAQMEGYLNAGFGAGYLKQPRIADLVQNALLFFDGQRYRLLAWVIMPNHVHVIAEMRDGFPLRSVIHSWKSFTASNANRILGREGPF